MKLFLIITFLLFSEIAIGCSVPYSGPKYDALINMSEPNSKGIYSITVPKNYASFKRLPILTLIYTNSDKINYKNIEFAQDISVVVKGNIVIGLISIDKNKGKNAYVQVVWSPDEGGMCASFGYSKLIRGK